MQTVIAIAALAGPPLFLFARYLSEYGFSFRKADGWGIFPALAVVLLAVHIALMMSPEAVRILNEQLFPVRGLLVFLISGIAFSVAIFPRLVAESVMSSPGMKAVRPGLLVAIPAWLWIILIVAVAAIKYGS